MVNNDSVKLSMGEAIRAEPAEGQEGTKCVCIGSGCKALYEGRLQLAPRRAYVRS